MPLKWVDRLAGGLAKTSHHLKEGIRTLFYKQSCDAASLEQLEELLISADVGVESAAFIIATLAKEKFDKGVSPEVIQQSLAAIITSILLPVTKPLLLDPIQTVILMVGVNGVGKTTTAGKLAYQWSAQGNKVVLAAADTFRAAAVEQLRIWASRAQATCIEGLPEADPASVAHQAWHYAKANHAQVLVVDTAGRLHTNTNLMKALGKCYQVLRKCDPAAPHHTLLVLDATTGYNAFRQVEMFSQEVPLTGLIVTKLDGSAKGGMVVGLAKRYGLPIYAIGVGETIEDLSSFDPAVFAKQLVGLP